MTAMVRADEAVQKAREWLAATGGVPADGEIRVHEFDLGYVVTPYVPPPPGQPVAPAWLARTAMAERGRAFLRHPRIYSWMPMIAS